jgi:hypothetical protein
MEHLAFSERPIMSWPISTPARLIDCTFAAYWTKTPTSTQGGMLGTGGIHTATVAWACGNEHGPARLARGLLAK